MPERSLKKRVSLEETKVRQTTHWDMDYLPRDEVQALYARDTIRPAEAFASDPPPKSLPSRQLGIICIVIGIGLLIVAVAAARLLSG